MKSGGYPSRKVEVGCDYMRDGTRRVCQNATRTAECVVEEPLDANILFVSIDFLGSREPRKGAARRCFPAKAG